MPAQIFGTDAVVTMLNRAFNDASPANATFKNQVAAAGTTPESQAAFALQFGSGYAGLTADALSTKLLGNLGVLPNADLQKAVADYITSVGVANVGIVALQLGQILSGLENATGAQVAFAPAAAAWNNEVTAAYNYSANAANTGPSTPGNPSPGTTFTLTAGADSLEPNSASATSKTTGGDDTLRALNTTSNVAGNTLNTTDVIDGGAGNDTLTVELANETAGAIVIKPVIKNVETLNITAVDATSAITLNLADSSGVTAINSKAGTNAQKSFTVAGVALGTAITLAGDHAAAVVTTTFAGTTGTADAVSVTLNKATGNGKLVLNAIETVNLASTGSANVLQLDASTVETVNVTGTFATSLTLGAAAAGTDTIKTIDASASSGNFTLAALATANNDVTIKGSSGNNVLSIGGAKKAAVTTLGGNDSITLGNSDASTVDSGAGNDQILVTVAAKHVITTGAGNDTVSFSGAAGAATSSVAKTTTIKDFTTGSDKISLAGLGATAVLTSQANLTAIQTAVDSLAADKTLADAVAAADAITATNGLSFFTFKGDTYVHVEQTGGGNAGDLIVKLTGAVSIAGGDFVLA